MARNTARTILQRNLDAREKLWPELTPNMLWSMDNEGWVALPRLMPLMLSIMDDLSGKGFPVSRTYLELWSRVRIEENFLAINRPEEMAFHAGFEGQRALRTWKDRIQRLAELGFIGVKPGPLGAFSFVTIYNPYHVIKRAYLAGKVHENKWQSLVIRANEISAFDLDDIDGQGRLSAVDDEEEDEDEEVKPKPRRVQSTKETQQKRVRRRPKRSKGD